MGIIECRVRNAFKNFEEHNDVYKFAIEMAHIGDYSIRSMYNWGILTDSVNKIRNEKDSNINSFKNNPFDFDDIDF